MPLLSPLPLADDDGRIIAEAIAFAQVENAEPNEIYPASEMFERLNGDWPKVVYYDNGFCMDVFAGFNDDGWPKLRRSGFEMADVLAGYDHPAWRGADVQS